MNIMIVEDDIVPANYLKKMLEAEGYRVVSMVTSGREAIKVAKQIEPDLIFMDIMLKDNISGAEAAREIHHFKPSTMIVFLTAYSDKEMIEIAVESNAFAYLLKPYRDKEILATLELAKAKIESIDNSASMNTVKNSIKVELVDGYIYNTQLNRVFKDEKEIPLGSKALKLIKLLSTNKHITLEIETIIKEVWDTPKSGQTLRSLIHRIRESTCYDLIQNSNKFGYKIGLKKR